MNGDLRIYPESGYVVAVLAEPRPAGGRADLGVPGSPAADRIAIAALSRTSHLAAARAPSDHDGVEPPIGHQDVTTIMMLLGDIQTDVRRIRVLLEEDDGEEEEEAPEDDA